MPNIRQAEQTNKTALRTPQKTEAKTAHYLDTLEQSDTPFIDGGYRASKNTFKKRAKYKAITVSLMANLIDLDSDLQKGYKLTYGFCSEILLHQGTKITSRYCGYRWCPICSRIRTAKYINGYTEPFSKMNEPYFVTLTAPTCTELELENTVNHRLEVWGAILKYAKTLYNRGKISYRLNGIRKLEITARPNGMFNPHFHIVVDGKESAELIKSQWLYRYPNADRSLQSIERANIDSLTELFKYITKFWSVDRETKEPIIFTPKQMDTIFRSIKQKRTVNPFGNIHRVSDEVDKLESVEVKDMTPKHDVSKWNNTVYDWIDTYGELASGYSPSIEDKKFIKKIEDTRQKSRNKYKR